MTQYVFNRGWTILPYCTISYRITHTSSRFFKWILGVCPSVSVFLSGYLWSLCTHVSHDDTASLTKQISPLLMAFQYDERKLPISISKQTVWPPLGERTSGYQSTSHELALDMEYITLLASLLKYWLVGIQTHGTCHIIVPINYDKGCPDRAAVPVRHVSSCSQEAAQSTISF